MTVEIITPERTLFEGPATSVTLPGADGSLGVLDRHAPMITTLQKGIVKIKTDKSEENFEVNGGTVEVFNNRVMILAE
ncbi:MAG: ATP synthase F1 subunit epsilon [Flavobacteriales bacterium]|nr:ATP synthase F1 subunit epsilon [Flavobacteriales bacterium]MDP4952769.1 ATP synthase F1 subunit epsilon [Flavobacteriales bacterium]